MRPQQYQVLDLLCNVGLDQSYSDELSAPNAFQTVDNFRIDTKGILQKRIGADAVGATATSPTFTKIVGDNVTSYAPNASFLAKAGDIDLLGTSNGSVFARDEESGIFNFAGKFSSVLPVRKRSTKFGSVSSTIDTNLGWGNTVPPSCAVNSDGYLLVVGASDQDGTHAFIESPDGVRIWTYRQSRTFARCIAVGATFYIVSSSGTTITAQSFTIANSVVTSGTNTTIATASSAATAKLWDITALTADWYLIHQNTAIECTVTMFTGLSNIATQAFAVTGNVPCSIWAEDGSGTNAVWAGYYNNPAATGVVSVRIYDTDLDNLVGSQSTMITNAPDILGPPLFGKYHSDTKGYGNTTKAFFVVRYQNNSSDYLCGCYMGVCTTTGTIDVSDIVYGAFPISKPDTMGRVWCLVDNGSSNAAFCRNALLRFHEPDLYDSTINLNNIPPTVEASDALVPRFGNYGPSVATGGSNYFGTIAEDGSAENRHYFAGTVPKAKNNSDSTYRGALNVYEYKPLASVPHMNSMPIGGALLTAGQPTQVFGQMGSQYKESPTGRTVGRLFNGSAEVGFLDVPVITLTSTSGSTGVGAGTYSYVAVFEWVDQYGQRHRSKPSEPVSVTIASAKIVTVTVSTSDLTQRLSNLFTASVVVQLYRSLNGGVEHHATVSEGLGQSVGSVASLDDDLPDADIDENEILYTDGGVLGNDLAPVGTFIAKTEDRVWIGGGWDRRIIECSKLLVPSEPVQFTGDPSHQVMLLDECTGLAFMDGQLVAFTENAIFVISGDGPNDQGQGSFAAPRVVSSGIGCSNYRSIVETAIGIFFQSTGGIYLLPRGFGQPIYIGDKVKDLFRAQPFVLSAAYRNDTNFHLVRFLIASTETGTTNDVLTYDITNGQWFRDYYEASSGVYTLSEIGNWKDGFAYMRGVQLAAASTNTIFQDSSSNYYDAGNTYMISQLKTNWIRPFGPNGWGMVKRAIFSSKMREDANVLFQIQIDANTVQSTAWDMLSSDAGYRELVPIVQKCTKIQILFADQAGYSSGKRGVDPIAISLELESDGKTRLLQASERA